ncbi:hypothetical protein PQY67_10660 [Pseudomonadales bacterium]|nr:hypothetical protein [Pseudomonadales bacterium]
MTKRLMLLALLNVLVSEASAKVIQVLPGHNTLRTAIGNSTDGDTLMLVDGVYSDDGSISTQKRLTLRSISPTIKPEIQILESRSFEMSNNANSTDPSLMQGIKLTVPDGNVSFTGNGKIILVNNEIDAPVISFSVTNAIVVGNQLNGSISSAERVNSFIFAGNKYESSGDSNGVSTGVVLSSHGNQIYGNEFKFPADGTNLKAFHSSSIVGNRIINFNRDNTTNYQGRNMIELRPNSNPDYPFNYRIYASNVSNNLIEHTGTNGSEILQMSVGGIVTHERVIATINNNLVIVKDPINPSATDISGWGLSIAYAGRATNNMIVAGGSAMLNMYAEARVETLNNLCFGNAVTPDTPRDRCPLDSRNIIADPKFAELTNYTLSADSPAVDAGDPVLSLNDLDGSRADIGLHGGPLGFLQYDNQRAPSDKPYLYPLFDQIDLSNIEAVNLKVISVARFK